ncbi:MAG: translation initiation factor IF-6 [Nitrosopumilus sp.]|nr:translation initiation factor IF-6 [Nitrosopumilus sp.]
MDIFKYDVYRGPNIGVYISVNDDFVFLPMGYAETKAEKLAKYLEVKPLYSAVSNTRLLGALMSMNNHGVLLPTTAYQDEYDFLKKETKLEVGVLDSKYTALGNVICANDKGAIVSPWLSKSDVETIKQVLDVEVVQKRISGLNQVGAMMVANNSGGVIHPEADEEDMKMFANVLGIHLEHSTINGGVPFVESGILVNNKAVVVGSMTTGPEIMMLTRAFLN